VVSGTGLRSPIDSAGAARGPVSVLINNAGIVVEKLAVDQTEADWDAVINANLKDAYFAATEMARRMIARKQEGNIINVASVLGFGVMKFVPPYAISKAGIVQATKVMALELVGNRIRGDAVARLCRYRDQSRIDARRRETDQTDSATPGRRRGRPRRRHHAARLQCLAVHDRQRGHGGWRVLADLTDRFRLHSRHPEARAGALLRARAVCVARRSQNRSPYPEFCAARGFPWEFTRLLHDIPDRPSPKLGP
jgi:NAD(P)-dependent dehydrogenase (short-subunit alcohol dehydrogenase family)